MLLVIFGAGASFDSSSSFPASSSPGLDERLPLAKDLFSDRPLFVEVRRKYPACHPIIPRLRKAGVGKAIERELAAMQDEGKMSPDRLRQLAAIQYYLQEMLWRCEVRWNDKAADITNYQALIDQIFHLGKRQEPICLVTFNYDRMLEHALPSFRAEN